MELPALLLSLGTSFVIFIVLMFLFNWLSRRRGNAVVYYSNRILKGLDPYEAGSLTRNPFAWIRESFYSSEQDIISISGVDTAVYFVFLRTALGILVVSGVIILPVLLPLAAMDEGIKISSSDEAFSKLDSLSMANITESSPSLWAFTGAVYWVSIVTYMLLWKAYKHVWSLRTQALMADDGKPQQYAVLVRDIPSPLKGGVTHKAFIDSYFSDIYPNTFYTSIVVIDNIKANNILNELEGYKKKLARAEEIYAETKNRPKTKTGFLGLVGKPVDSIEYYNEKINQTVPKLESERKYSLQDEKQQNAALVFFTNRVAAASAAQSLHCQMVNKWIVSEAPEPRQLIWTNLNIKFFIREIRKYIVYFIVGVTIIFYMIPIAFVSSITTLENLQKILPFIKPVVEIVPLKIALEAYLPQIALIVFLAMLPKILLFLSKAEGIPSESHAQRAASGKYFYFIVMNVFIGVAISGTLFDTLGKLKKHPDSIVSILATSLPKNATFFLTYVALKFFVGYGLELSRIIPLIIFHLKKKYLCKTEADVKEAWYPGDLSYATRVPGDLLILTITLCYSVMAPLIIPFGIVYFGLGWLILKNQALKVYVPSYESYGEMWPHIHNRIIAVLLLSQVTMLGYLGIKEFYYTALLIPLIIFTLIFAYICNTKFYRSFKHIPLEVACRGRQDTPDLEHVVRSYVPSTRLTSTLSV